MIISVNDGLTPYIGDNGYWFIGDTDTGVCANGQSTTNIETITLPASGWSGLSQTVSCAGILADETKQVITVFPAMASRDEYMDSGITCTGVGANMLIFTADAALAADLIVHVAIEEAGGGSSNVYSTEETVVGTWVDGKPIYRRTFFGVMDSDEYTRVCRLSDLDGESVVTMTAICNHSSSSSAQMPTGYYGSNGAINIYRDGSGQIILYVSSGNNFKSQPYTATVEYTKTTDTATIPIASAAALMNAYEEGVNEA